MLRSGGPGSNIPEGLSSRRAVPESLWPKTGTTHISSSLTAKKTAHFLAAGVVMHKFKTDEHPNVPLRADNHDLDAQPRQNNQG
jgi:hypothetical protein